MRTQAEKAAAFRVLHERAGAFIIPNPWEASTAMLLAAMGFEALATTSLGLANMLGRADSHVTRAEVIANCRVIVEATDRPVNADLENGFAHEPEAPAGEWGGGLARSRDHARAGLRSRRQADQRRRRALPGSCWRRSSRPRAPCECTAPSRGCAT